MEVILGATISGVFALLVAVAPLFFRGGSEKRLAETEVDEASVLGLLTEVHIKNEVLVSGIKGHILLCPVPDDLKELL